MDWSSIYNRDNVFFPICFRKMSSELEKAMITIVQIFQKYSRHKCTLKKIDLKDLINNEMRQFIMVSVWDLSNDEVMCLCTGCERSDSPVIQIQWDFLFVFYEHRFLLSNQAKYEAICLSFWKFAGKSFTMTHPKNI